jgi:NDP-mannose synthase
MSFEAVVLAGGKGARLSPFTYVLPKPLLPLGQRPILDIVLTQLARAGCIKATLAIGHLGHYIEVYCGDGSRWGLEIDYFREEEPLGTVGAVAQIPRPDAPFVMMNGDVVSDVSIAELVEAHRSSGAELTIGSFRRTERDELGVIDTDGDGRVTGYREKPEHEYLVSMGIYVVTPAVIEVIPSGRRMDFPELVQELIGRERPVRVHVHSEFWLDLGRTDDFMRANEEAGEIFERLGIDP